jgi:hypothetical protein
MGLEALQQGVGADEVDDGDLFLLFRSLFVLVADELTTRESRQKLLFSRLELFVIENVPEDVVVDTVPEVGDLAGCAARTPSER